MRKTFEILMGALCAFVSVYYFSKGDQTAGTLWTINYTAWYYIAEYARKP